MRTPSPIFTERLSFCLCCRALFSHPSPLHRLRVITPLLSFWPVTPLAPPLSCTRKRTRTYRFHRATGPTVCKRRETPPPLPPKRLREGERINTRTRTRTTQKGKEGGIPLFRSGLAASIQPFRGARNNVSTLYLLPTHPPLFSHTHTERNTHISTQTPTISERGEKNASAPSPPLRRYSDRTR